MKIRFVLALVVSAVAGGTTADAHHSFAATYDPTEIMQIEGRIVQFQFRNPHSFVHVEAPDENGEVFRWAVEWGGAGQLGAQGVTSQTLSPGDEVTIVGSPGRNPNDRRLLMRSLYRTSDGFGWGQRPDEVFD